MLRPLQLKMLQHPTSTITVAFCKRQAKQGIRDEAADFKFENSDFKFFHSSLIPSPSSLRPHPLPCRSLRRHGNVRAFSPVPLPMIPVSYSPSWTLIPTHFGRNTCGYCVFVERTGAHARAAVALVRRRLSSSQVFPSCSASQARHLITSPQRNANADAYL